MKLPQAYYVLLFIYLLPVLFFISCTKGEVEIEEETSNEYPIDIPKDIKYIEVQKPGTLATVLQKDGLTTVVNLKISGSLNDEDLLTLTRMGRYESLKYLDLSDAYMFDFKWIMTNILYGVSVDQLIVSNHVTEIRMLQDVKKIYIPDNVTKIGSMCFYGSKINSIQLPNRLTCIDCEAFSYCENLKRLELPESVESVGENAFAYSNIEYVYLGENIKYIECGVFNGCYSLKELYMNMDSIPELINHEDTYYSDLGKISLGENVKYIDYEAFSSLLNLKSVYCYNSAPPIVYSEGTFDDTYFLMLRAKNPILYVPRGSMVDYWNASQFSSVFLTIKEIE